ncbi:MAG: M56 family metallopeptidase [Saprospiraceae bacterium]|nr:M56 family metallopeptidase [Saprospiraceae bacterium]
MKTPDFIFSAGLDRALGWTVLHSLWQFTLIALLTSLLFFLLRNRAAKIRCWVGNLALVAALLVAVATFSWYNQSGTAMPPQAVPTPPAATQPAALNIPAPVDAPMTGLPADSLAPAGLLESLQPHLPLIVLFWFLGLGIFLLRLMSSLLYVNYLRRRMNFHADPYWVEVLEKLLRKSGLRTGVELLESAMVRSPLTIGYLKPVILFPIGLINHLSETEVEAILAHELAHILRRDYLFNILQSLIEALFYYHPAIWWLSAQVRNERESASDDMAIALLGNKINYAKALVAIQEMAFFPQTPALAFAGQGRSQFGMRLRRIFKQPKTKFNTMEKWIATGLVVCSMLVLAIGQRIQTLKTDTSARTETTTTTSPFSGIWEAEFGKDSVCLSFTSKTNGGHWTTGECFLRSEFKNLSLTPGDTEFQLARPAGIMTLSGKIEGPTGYGRFQFAPDENYRKALVQQGLKETNDELLVHCFFAGFAADYPTVLKKAGYSDLSTEQYQELAVFRIEERDMREYQALAAQLGKKNLSVQDLIELRIGNVDAKLVNQLSKAGYKDLDMSEVSQFGMHGISPDYIESMNKLGFGKLSAEEILSAKIQGIDADFVKKCQNMDLGKLSFDEIVSIKIHEVDADFIRQCQNMGFGKLSMDDVMSIKIHDVDPDFIEKCQNMGFGKLSLEDIMAMKIHSINADFIQQCQNAGFGKLSLEDIMAMKIHDIDADFIQQCQNAGFGKLSLEDIMAMKIHDIDADFIQQCQNLGLGTLSMEDIMSFRIHNIDAEWAKQFRELGFKTLTAEDLLSARIHEISPEFIKAAEKRGYRFPSLEEYVELKIRDQSRDSNRK